MRRYLWRLFDRLDQRVHRVRYLERRVEDCERWLHAQDEAWKIWRETSGRRTEAVMLGMKQAVREAGIPIPPAWEDRAHLRLVDERPPADDGQDQSPLAQ
jgi:hypothetical protein